MNDEYLGVISRMVDDEARIWVVEAGIVTTHGAMSGGRLCDRDSRSWAASVSSILRSRNIRCGAVTVDWAALSVLGLDLVSC